MFVSTKGLFPVRTPRQEWDLAVLAGEFGDRFWIRKDSWNT